MREIVLDTETTGLEPENGDRIVEIGAVELVNHMPTGNNYHQYINPERTMPQQAFQVHGLGDDFLRTHPVFAEIAADFVAFLGDAPLVIHNAAFDMKFINAELARLQHPPIPFERAVDTLDMARRKFPGAPASLDALCRRFGVDNSTRTLHGALLDCEILAEVYLQLIGGRQPDFGLAPTERATRNSGAGSEALLRPGPRREPLSPRLTQDETDRHAAFIKTLEGDPLWNRLKND